MSKAKEIIKDVKEVESKAPSELSDIPMADEALDKVLSKLPVGQDQLRKMAEDAAADILVKGKEAGKEWVRQRIERVGQDFMDSFEQYSLSPEQQRLAIGALAAFIEVHVNEADQTAQIAVRRLGSGLGITADIGEDNYSAVVDQPGVGKITVQSGAGGWRELPRVELEGGQTRATLDSEEGVGLGTTVGKVSLDAQVGDTPGAAIGWRGEVVTAEMQADIDGAASAAITAFEGRVSASASGDLRESELDEAALQVDLGKLTVDAAKVGDQYAGRLGVDLGKHEISLYGSGGEGERPSFGATYETEVKGQGLRLETAVDPHGFVTTKASVDTSVATVSASYDTETRQVQTKVTRKF